MTAQALPFVGRRPAEIERRRLLWLALIVTSAVLYVVFAGQWTIPHSDDQQLFLTINEVRDWLDANRDNLGLFTVFIEVLRGKVPPAKALNLEIAALYWHFVDVVWIVIFPVVYLMN